MAAAAAAVKKGRHRVFGVAPVTGKGASSFAESSLCQLANTSHPTLLNPCPFVLHTVCLCCPHTQVKQLLADAKDPDVLLTALPSLLEPRTLISVLVTVRKW
jgi:hypothetical protein